MAKEQPSLLRLSIEKGPRSGETPEFFPTTSPIRLGRVVRGNSLPIKDPGISTKHLTIEFKSSQWIITDLESSNGTVLNSIQLPPLSPVVLKDGDMVKIGEVTVIRVGIVDSELGNEVEEEERHLRGRTRREKAEGKDVELGFGEELGKKGVEEEKKVLRGRARREKGGVTGEDTELGFDEELVKEVKEEEKLPRGRTRREKAMAKDVELGFGRELGKEDEEKHLRGRTRREKAAVIGGDGEWGKRVLEEEKKLPRGRTRREKVVEENSELGFGGDLGKSTIGERKRGRGRPKKEKVEIFIEDGNENSNSVEEVGDADKVFEGKTGGKQGRRGKEKMQNIEELCPVKVENLPHVSTRRTRSLRMVENAEKEDFNVNVGNIKKSEKGKKINKDINGKSDLGEGNCIGKESVINVQSGDGLNSEKVVVKCEPRESFCEMENVKNSLNLEKEMDEREERQAESVKESGSKGREETPDLTKMTLGEYFDYLEVSLPKQIIEETEIIISEMHQKAEKYREFVREREKDKVNRI